MLELIDLGEDLHTQKKIEQPQSLYSENTKCTCSVCDVFRGVSASVSRFIH